MAKTRPRTKTKKTKTTTSGADDLWSTLAKITEGLAESTRLLPPTTTCGCCGQKFSDPEVLAAHVEARAYRGRRKKPAGGPGPTPRPDPPASKTSKPSTPSKPAAGGGSSSGGSAVATTSVQMLHRASTAIPEEVDHDTKLGELDALLLSLRYAQLRLAEGISELADRLVAEVWVDPSVALAVEETAAQVAESSEGYQEARRRLRVVYAEQIEAKGRHQPRTAFFEE